MRTLTRLLALAAIVLLAACSSMEQVKDFEERSVVYGWVDIKDIEINTIDTVFMQQYRPKTDKPFYSMGVRKYRDGFLLWAISLPNGSHKLDAIKGQTCLGILCGNTFYTYSFGQQGDDIGAVVIKSPGVYYLGAHKLANEKTGFFEPGKFKVTPAPNAPTRRELLEELLKDKNVDVPVMRERIQRELGRV